MTSPSMKSILKTKECHGKNDIAEIIKTQQEACRGCKGIEMCRQIPQGFIPVSHETFGRTYSAYQECRYEKQRREQYRIERLFSTAGIPLRYKGFKKEEYKVTEQNEKAVALAKYVAESDTGAFFYGTSGTGKTLLASLIASKKINDGEQVLFISVPELIDELRASMREGSGLDRMELAKQTSCLVLDDLGAERMTEWVGSQIFSILDYRLNHSLQTIITSNYSPTEIAERLSDGSNEIQGKRIMSRIGGLCKVARVDGRDGRLNE